MNKILITGSSGFLGKKLVSALVSNYFVSTLSRVNSIYSFDLSSDIPVFNETFDIVIHAAGLAHISSNFNKSKNQFFKVNVIGTQNLLSGLKFSGVPKKFVFISSVAVYGISSGIYINETYDLLANDSYGLSKIEAEKIVLKWCEENNVHCTILRLPLIVGGDSPGNLGAMINGIKKGFYFNIAGGNAKKSMVLAIDVAKFIVKASDVGGVYNLTDGQNPSFFELSNHLANQLGTRPPINIPIWLAKMASKIGDLIGSKAPLNSKKFKKIISDLTFDDSKARSSFGWKPTPVLSCNFISEI
uniref:NAD-dependent epimerase/dehydratase family protein n=1 Tax=Algoriphagus sp. TaxID=1872435 RepID=UPI0040474236